MATIICILLRYQGSKTILSGHLVPQPDHLNCWRHNDVTHNIWSHTFTVFCNTCTPLCRIKFELMTISLCHLPTAHSVNTKSILQSFCSNLRLFSNFGCQAKGDLQQKKIITILCPASAASSHHFHQERCALWGGEKG